MLHSRVQSFNPRWLAHSLGVNDNTSMIQNGSRIDSANSAMSSVLTRSKATPPALRRRSACASAIYQTPCPVRRRATLWAPSSNRTAITLLNRPTAAAKSY